MYKTTSFLVVSSFRNKEETTSLVGHGLSICWNQRLINKETGCLIHLAFTTTVKHATMHATMHATILMCRTTDEVWHLVNLPAVINLHHNSVLYTVILKCISANNPCTMIVLFILQASSTLPISVLKFSGR